ncbi:MAG: T9SS type A sorting domain-containing protein [Bacteroidetes bacterium]|nr:T9SS type A sorting domain-containing protein [Bacteroidota bacterium]
MKHTFYVSVIAGLLFTGTTVNAQFAPSVDEPGTTAMYKDSSAFVEWASTGKIIRGLQDISMPGMGYTNVGDSTSAFGIAGTTGVVSLGDGGIAILGFSAPISDDAGPDFAVFENSFNDSFLELAFVEVSSDGIHFFRFPATSNTDTTIQTAGFGATDASSINNLAGKYRGLYGTPFDLDDIPDDALLNKQAITHVKIIDVVGCIQNQYATRDVNHHKVNDPWPTGFGSGGFDLDAVGVIHQQAQVGIKELVLGQVSVYPNPATDVLFVSMTNLAMYSVSVTNLMGELVLQTDNNINTAGLNINELKQGVYILTITANGQQRKLKFVKS